MKNDGLKRGLQSMDSSDYQMAETITGKDQSENRQHEVLFYVSIYNRDLGY